MSEWAVYPAIDLRAGRVVRLAQGDPARETWYSDDPSSVAVRWRDAGAEWVHVINLDGALDQAGALNAGALEAIIAVGVKVQFGGGMRDLQAMRRAAELGVRRVIIGTAAVEDPALVEAALAELGAERVAVGIDARDGAVRTHGWRREEGVSAVELAQWWKRHGAKWVIYTDVGRDGMGSGINLAATVELARDSGMSVIAAGGAASLDDVRQVRAAGLAGVVLGRALYEDKVDLAKALAVGEEKARDAG